MNYEWDPGWVLAAPGVRHSTFGVRYSTFRDRGPEVEPLHEFPKLLVGSGFPDTAKKFFAKKHRSLPVRDYNATGPPLQTGTGETREDRFASKGPNKDRRQGGHMAGAWVRRPLTARAMEGSGEHRSGATGDHQAGRQPAASRKEQATLTVPGQAGPRARPARCPVGPTCVRATSCAYGGSQGDRLRRIRTLATLPPRGT